MHLSPLVGLTAVRSKAMVLLMLTFCLLLLQLWESVIVLCFCTLLYVHSSFAIILMGKRELVTLLSLTSWCLVMVMWLFLAVPWVCLRFVIVVFLDHTHLFVLSVSCSFVVTYWERADDKSQQTFFCIPFYHSEMLCISTYCIICTHVIIQKMKKKVETKWLVRVIIYSHGTKLFPTL